MVSFFGGLLGANLRISRDPVNIPELFSVLHGNIFTVGI